MSTHPLRHLGAISLVFLLGSAAGFADQFGAFTYQVLPNGTVEITDYPEDAVGEIEIPPEIDGRTVTSIRGAEHTCESHTIGGFGWGDCSGWSGAFAGCARLTKIAIPASVTHIGDGAFAGCQGLTALQASPGNPTYSSDEGVLFNASMTTLLFCPRAKAGTYLVPDNVTRIGGVEFFQDPDTGRCWQSGEGAFAGCRNLTGVVIPAGVQSIGNFAFSHCSGLTRLILHEGIREIGDGAFLACTALTEVTIPSSILVIGSGESGCTENELPPQPTGAFQACTALTRMILSDGVTRIHGWSFAGCTRLPTIVIPASVTELGSETFRGCLALSSITLGSGLSSISPTAFGGGWGLFYPEWGYTGNLTTIEVDPDNPYFRSVDGVLFNHDQTEIVRYPPGRGGAYTIPVGVTSVASYAFAGCSGLAEVTIPANVTRIGWYAFDQCTSLSTVTFLGNPPWFWGAFEGTPEELRFSIPGTPPVPVLDADSLSIALPPDNISFRYSAEASIDLRNWSTVGVSVGEPDLEGRRTASVGRDGPTRFLRMVIQYCPIGCFSGE